MQFLGENYYILSPKAAQGDETSPSTGRRGGGIVFEKNQFNTIPYF
jgi:hypothetical protein